jgi:hypothetical protein
MGPRDFCACRCFSVARTKEQLRVAGIDMTVLWSWRDDSRNRRAGKACRAPTAERELLGGAQGEEVLGAFDRVLEAAEKLLEVFATLDEVDVGGVDDEEIRGRVAEEEVFVGCGDFFDVFGGDLGLVAGGFFGDACAEDFRFGLEVDDKIGSGNAGGQGFVEAIVEFQLFVIEIEIGEDTVFLEQEIGENWAGSFDGESFANALLAFDEEVHLGAEGGAGFFLVEVGEEGIVFAVVDAAGVETFGEDFGEGGLADAKRAFDDDKAGGLRAALWFRSALSRGGIVGRHRFVGPREKPLERLLE